MATRIENEAVSKREIEVWTMQARANNETPIIAVASIVEWLAEREPIMLEY